MRFPVYFTRELLDIKLCSLVYNVVRANNIKGLRLICVYLKLIMYVGRWFVYFLWESEFIMGSYEWEFDFRFLKHVRGSKSSYADFQEKQLNIRAAMLFTSEAVLKLDVHSGHTNHNIYSWIVTLSISQLCKLHVRFIY